METRKKKVCVHFVHEETIKHMILTKDEIKKRPLQLAGRNDQPDSDTETEDLVDSSPENVYKCPEIRSTLLCDDIGVTGRELFSIRSPAYPYKRKVGKESLSVSSSKTPGLVKETPIKTSKKKSATRSQSKIVPEPTKTPYGTRNKFKRELAKRAQAVVKGGNSDSEFSPSNSEGSSDEEESGSEENSNSEEEAKPVTTLKSIQVPARRVSLRQKERNNDDLKYVIDADEYFRYGKAKSRTSNHTLGKLKTPRLPPNELRTLLENTKKTHETPIKNLLEEQQRTFAKWLFVLSEGHSVLTYGVGSKRTLLNSFHKQSVSLPVVVCNGYFPSLTINQILDTITEGVLGVKESLSLADSIELVERSFHAGSRNQLVLIVHNIEGPCLRSSKSQEILARMARLRNIWLVASIDHINGPTMWDQTMLSNFNFSYWDATSLLPYTEETSYESSLMIQRTGTLMLSSLTNVFKSLTTNAQGIFMVIADYQLTRSKAKGVYPGMLFKDLYRSCRDKMLVSSDQTLRAQLTEFLDHKLITSKRGTGGSEMLVVPLDAGLLETFLEQRTDE